VTKTGSGMSFQLVLRTGFFKKERYDVMLAEDALDFVACSDETGRTGFAVPYDEIRLITVYGTSPAEIEIRTAEKAYIGTWPPETGPEKREAVVAQLKRSVGNRLIYHQP